MKKSLLVVLAFTVFFTSFGQTPCKGDSSMVHRYGSFNVTEEVQDPSVMRALDIRLKSPNDLKGIEKLKCLKKLRLEGESGGPTYVNIDEFSAQLAQLDNLEDLELVNVRFSNMVKCGEVIQNQHQLKRLVLINTNLAKTISDIQLPKSIEELKISVDELEAIPLSLFELKELKNLDLGFNKIKELPKEIGKLNKLVHLSLNANEIEYLAEEISALSHLETLILSDNRLKELPKNIGSLTDLKVLELKRNSITTIPVSMGTLIALERLNLSENQLKEIPVEMGSLESLSYLNLDKNEMVGLPNQLCQLLELRYLIVSNNRLKDLPLELKQLLQFKTEGNDFTKEPALFTFYKKKVDDAIQRENEKRELYQELAPQMKIFEEANAKFLNEEFIENEDSLIKAYIELAPKIARYNDVDYVSPSNLGDVQFLKPVLRAKDIIQFSQDVDKTHVSFVKSL